ncbi:hypothetical protein V8C42DRAFT_287115 [Trichoderma barbatum]
MAFQTSIHPALAATQSQHLISFAGGDKMLKDTTNDTSYRSFAAAADGTYNNQPLSGNTSSSESTGANFPSTFQDLLHLSNRVRSPQPAPDFSSFPTIPSPVDAFSDWPQQQPGAANDDARPFSSSCQGPGLSRSYLPLFEVQPPMLEHYPPPQAHEHPSQRLQYDFQAVDKGHLHFPPRCLRSGSFSLPTSSRPYVDDGSSIIPARPPYLPPGQPDDLSYSPSIHSGHSSQKGTSSIIFSTGDMNDVASNMTMLPTLNYAQGDLFGHPPNRLIHDATSQTEIKAIGSASFQTDWKSSPSVSSLSHSPSETNSSASWGGKWKGKEPQTPSTRQIRRLSDPYFPPIGSPGSQPLDQSQRAGRNVRRLSTGQVRILPRTRPNTLGVTTRSGVSTITGKPIPKKPRGKRTGPLGDGRRELATRRRNERTVCIGCKMAKVVCDGREDGRDCVRCASSHSNAPKPFVCAPASFFELVQQGSTVLLALHTIYPFSPDSGCRQPIGLPLDIHIRSLLQSIDELRRWNDAIRVYGRQGMLYELNLQACWGYINSTCAPTVHPFQRFINGLKVQRQDMWKTCIRDSRRQPLSKEKLCDALLALDDMAPWVTYSLKPKPRNSIGGQNDEPGAALTPDNALDRQIIIVAAQLSRIIGRKLELQFYDHLKKALANPSICRDLVLDVGRTLMSLRRRLAQWSFHWAGVPYSTPSEHNSGVDEDRGNGSSLFSDPVSRIRHLCQVLYVYFCYMRRRLSLDDQEGIRTMKVLYPDGLQEVEESFPQYESIDGFEEWLQFKGQPNTDTDMDNNLM